MLETEVKCPGGGLMTGSYMHVSCSGVFNVIPNGEFFLLCLFLNNHVVLVKELNVLLVQDLHSLAFAMDFPMHFLQNPTHKYP